MNTYEKALELAVKNGWTVKRVEGWITYFDRKGFHIRVEWDLRGGVTHLSTDRHHYPRSFTGKRDILFKELNRSK